MEAQVGSQVNATVWAVTTIEEWERVGLVKVVAKTKMAFRFNFLSEIRGETIRNMAKNRLLTPAFFILNIN